MKVNNVYAEEIAKWDGDKATKPFSVLWDDPESGADLKVVYRTPKLAGSIILVIGLAAIVGSSLSRRSTMAATIGRSPRRRRRNAEKAHRSTSTRHWITARNSRRRGKSCRKRGRLRTRAVAGRLYKTFLRDCANE
jgi:hypothetical protein